MKKLPLKFRRLLEGVKGKRANIVIHHILEHGQITTEELKDIYRYDHPPRAIRDVREQGVPIETFSVPGSANKTIAAYKFGDPSEIRSARFSGRTAFSSKLKSALLGKHGARCNIYLRPFPEKELQIDHRIPFEIAGENEKLFDKPKGYMLLCASANRAKSWSCEHCENWKMKKIAHCRTCYWAYPESYSHIAMREIRRVDILWAAEEISEYVRLQKEALKVQEEIPEYVKKVLRNHFRKEDNKK